MNNLGLKQKAVAAWGGMVLLYALAAGLWFMVQKDAWKKSMKHLQQAKIEYAKETRLIAEKPKWEQDYEEAVAQMTNFRIDAHTDTPFMRELDELAARHKMVLDRIAPDPEAEEGEMHETPITVGSWKGSFKHLIDFLYELDNSEKGMYDVSRIKISPSKVPGYLEGNFTVNCAYMRDNGQ